MRRNLARLAILREQIKAIEQAHLERLQQAPETGPNAMIRLLASILGVGIETADTPRAAINPSVKLITLQP
jgi:transposase